jgi:hypothetical protein
MQIVVFSLLIGIIIDRFNAVSGKGILTERQRDFKQLTQNILTGADRFHSFLCVSVSLIPPHLACVNLVCITPRLLSPGVCLLAIVQAVMGFAISWVLLLQQCFACPSFLCLLTIYQSNLCVTLYSSFCGCSRRLA